MADFGDFQNSDAFSVTTMTEKVDRIPTVPTFLGSLGLFDEEGIDTKLFAIEQKANTLNLIPTSPRGTEPPMGTTDRRSLRYFECPRIAKGDQVFAHEVAGVRAYGKATELETFMAKVAQKQARLMTDMNLTEEYHRLGAISGILLDADGTTTLYNWFTEFNITQPAEIDFDLDNPTPASGALIQTINAAKRTVIRALGAKYVPGMVEFLWLCGDTFMDQFTNHPEVRATYANWQAAESLRSGNVFNTFRFGDMNWHNYQGTDDNTTVAIGATKAKLIVRGVPGLFRRANSFHDSADFVNTIGQRYYSGMVWDNDRRMWAKPELYAYPVHLCTRPEVLLRGRNT